MREIEKHTQPQSGQLMFDDDVESERCACRPQPGQLVFALIFKYLQLHGIGVKRN